MTTFLGLDVGHLNPQIYASNGSIFAANQQIGIDALATAQFRYRTLAPEAIQNNANLLLSGELTASVAADILDRLFGV